MFTRFLFYTVLISGSIWYFHEYHPVTFMKIATNIPILSPLMVDIHKLFKPAKEVPSTKTEEEFFTVEELSRYRGDENSKGIYIAVLGRVFDVKKGKKHYQPGSGYHVFTGKDASRAFVTGDFSEEKASDDVIDLNHSELLSLQHWVEFYDENYEYKGKLIGRYFTSTGTKTDYHKKLNSLIREAERKKSNKEEEKKKFPPCNTSWNADEGSRVWCTVKSGGIHRSWVGVPRKLYEVGSDKYQCVCVDHNQLEDPSSPVYARRGHLEEYKDCHPKSDECFYGQN